MNHAVIYTHLMLISLLVLLTSGCTRNPSDSPVEFEERSTRRTENMTPEEWSAFKNKAIESIIRKYSGKVSAPSPSITVKDLSATPTQIDETGDTSSDTVTQSPVQEETYEPEQRHHDTLVIPHKLTPTTLPAMKTPPKKSEEHTVEKVERYSQLKIKPEETKGKQYKIPPNALTQAEPDTLKEKVAEPAVSKYMWPVNGTVSMGYGKTEKGTNNGINIKATANAPVVAIERGKVIFVGAIKGMGKVILIEHPNQMIAAYAQVGSIAVRVNDSVKKGQKIASILSDGTDGELHFELRQGTKGVNPLDHLPR